MCKKRHSQVYWNTPERMWNTKQLKHQRMKIQIKPFLRFNQPKDVGIPVSGAVPAAKSKLSLKIAGDVIA